MKHPSVRKDEVLLLLCLFLTVGYATEAYALASVDALSQQYSATLWGFSILFAGSVALGFLGLCLYFLRQRRAARFGRTEKFFARAARPDLSEAEVRLQKDAA